MGKGKGRWKEDSVRNVGRTDEHKGDFILCPMLCIALHWTDKKTLRTNIAMNDTYDTRLCYNHTI